MWIQAYIFMSEKRWRLKMVYSSDLITIYTWIYLNLFCINKLSKTKIRNNNWIKQRRGTWYLRREDVCSWQELRMCEDIWYSCFWKEHFVKQILMNGNFFNRILITKFTRICLMEFISMEWRPSYQKILIQLSCDIKWNQINGDYDFTVILESGGIKLNGNIFCLFELVGSKFDSLQKPINIVNCMAILATFVSLILKYKYISFFLLSK